MKTCRKFAWMRVFCIVLICILIMSGVRMDSSATQVYHSHPNGARQIALTFDDGPHPSQTQRILDILDRYGVKATFFMIGLNVENYPDAAKLVVERGHEIGNHTYSHSHLNRLGAGMLTSELDKCAHVLENVCHYHTHLFRPPEGYLSDGVFQCAEQGEYSLILWSIDTRDWEIKDAQRIAETVLNNVKAGDIILMHDYVAKSKTPEALEILLPKLLALGYEPVTVSQLLGIG